MPPEPTNTEVDLALVVTDQDVEQGWKTVPATRRSGKEVSVRLLMLRAQKSIEIWENILNSKATTFDLLQACLAPEMPSNLLDTLSFESLGALKEIALKLSFGNDFPKKLADLAARLRKTTQEVTAEAGNSTSISPGA